MLKRSPGAGVDATSRSCWLMVDERGVCSSMIVGVAAVLTFLYYGTYFNFQVGTLRLCAMFGLYSVEFFPL